MLHTCVRLTLGTENENKWQRILLVYRDCNLNLPNYHSHYIKKIELIFYRKTYIDHHYYALYYHMIAPIFYRNTYYECDNVNVKI